MARQETHCAFTKACAVSESSPHVRVPGTGKVVCLPHSKVLTSATAIEGGECGFTSGAVTTPHRRRRSSWMQDTLSMVSS